VSDLPRGLTDGALAAGKRWALHEGDAPKVLENFPAGSVNCVVTSPPYYWQRDYGHPEQLGHEPTVDGYVGNLLEVFAEVWRVLRADGTVWLVIGDTFYSAKGRPHGSDRKHRGRRMAPMRAVDRPGLGVPRKSLLGIPWRVALALQEAGWTIRADIAWVRPSPLPEPSARDRPHRSAEHVFLLAKQPRYYFNRAALGGAEDVWIIAPDGRNGHCAPFPPELARRCVASGCPEGGVVLDPFLGSGTTAAAALELGRYAVGIELVPAFCELAAQRIASAEASA
jgi:DNA modification methylase